MSFNKEDNSLTDYQLIQGSPKRWRKSNLAVFTVEDEFVAK